MILLLQAPKNENYRCVLPYTTHNLYILANAFYLFLILLVFLLLIVSLMHVKWYGFNFHFLNELGFEHFCVLLDHLHEQMSIKILCPFYFIYVPMTPAHQQPLAF